MPFPMLPAFVALAHDDCAFLAGILRDLAKRAARLTSCEIFKTSDGLALLLRLLQLTLNPGVSKYGEFDLFIRR